jgi:beta-xylosidase
MDELSLINGKSNYGKGSWASSIRYHNGMYYIATYAQTTDKTYIFRTKDIEKGKWEKSEFKPGYHDCTLVFDKGSAYLITGGGRLQIIELNEDLTGVKQGGVNQVLIENASAPTEPNMLKAEGSQLFIHDGKYYLFNISWPRGGMRTVLVHRADNLLGPWEGRIALQDKGVAQGSIIDTPDGLLICNMAHDGSAKVRDIVNQIVKNKKY